MQPGTICTQWAAYTTCCMLHARAVRLSTPQCSQVHHDSCKAGSLTTPPPKTTLAGQNLVSGTGANQGETPSNPTHYPSTSLQSNAELIRLYRPGCSTLHVQQQYKVEVSTGTPNISRSRPPPVISQHVLSIYQLSLIHPHVLRTVITFECNKVLSLITAYAMTGDGLHFILVLTIQLDWWYMGRNTIVPKVPK